MKKMICMLLCLVLIALNGCSFLFFDSKDADEPTVQPTTEQTVSEPTTVLKEYYQGYPVQDYQKAYARFLGTFDTYEQAFIIHIDADEIPELVVNECSRTVLIFGYDGTEVYEAGKVPLCQYGFDFYYRPYLGMAAGFIGSVMYGNYHMIISTYEKEDGRLKEVDCIHIAPPAEAYIAENHGGCSGITHYCEYDDIIEYDTLGDNRDSLGESWKNPDKDSIVDESKIQYWLNN